MPLRLPQLTKCSINATDTLYSFISRMLCFYCCLVGAEQVLFAKHMAKQVIALDVAPAGETKALGSDPSQRHIILIRSPVKQLLSFAAKKDSAAHGTLLRHKNNRKAARGIVWFILRVVVTN